MRSAPCRRAVGVLLTALSLLASATAPATAAPADLLFRHGAVYTVNPKTPWASAVAVDDGRIVFVGDEKAASEWIGPDTEVVDLAGRMLLPGFHDSHMHPMRAGTRFLRCQLGGLAWPDEVLDALRGCEERLRPGQWLRGTDLADEPFDTGQLDRKQLDAIAPDRPAYITGWSGFRAWANSTALDMAGIDASTPDPTGGSIERRPGNQEPTGVLHYDAAGKIYALIPEPDETDLREALRLASGLANSFGITSSNEAMMLPENWQAFVAADQAGELTLRIQGSQAWDETRGLEQVEEMTARSASYASPYLSAHSVKLFLDGSLVGNQTAALIDPYVSTNNSGKLHFSVPGQLSDIVVALDRAGLNTHMHAVGDRAVRAGLDAIETAIKTNPPRDRRHQMAHLVLVDHEDLPRFAQLGVTADYQALWAYLDEERQREGSLLGPERAGHMIAIRSMLDTGARMVLGSDWISESMNPLYSIQIAVTRRPPDGSGPAWLPKQRISLKEAIRAYTLDGAWLARHENLTGSIEVGKAADLVVLEKNLFEIDPMKISQVKVDWTLLDGKTVYRRTSSQP